MPSATNDDHVPFTVPTVNIAPYLQDPESEAATEIIEEIRRACISTGFFLITDHGISKELQQGAFKAAEKFFKLPFEEKNSLDCRKTVGHRGYDVLASQSYEDGIMPDLKEGFYVAEDLPLEHPWVKSQRIFQGPNVWPSDSSLNQEDFRGPVEQYYSAMMKLAQTVLDLMARTLPYGAHVFDEFRSQNPLAILRLLHYPPASKTEGKKQFGASAHTDFGAITLLLTDENPGLEVLDEGKNEWVPIPPKEGAYVVNVGDMLSKWTDNIYKSSWHRVLNKNPKDRYSIVFFFDGNLDCPLAPLDGHKVGGKVMTVEDHMVKRLTESYGPKK